MANGNGSTRYSNIALVPEAREALDRFKMEAAADLGVFLTTKNEAYLTKYLKDHQ